MLYLMTKRSIRLMASRPLFDVLRDELGEDALSETYDPGDEKSDPYGFFASVNIWAHRSANEDHDAVERVTKIVVSAYCEADECESEEEKTIIFAAAATAIEKVKEDYPEPEKKGFLSNVLGL